MLLWKWECFPGKGCLPTATLEPYWPLGGLPLTAWRGCLVAETPVPPAFPVWPRNKPPLYK